MRIETPIDASPERCFDLSLDVDVHMRSMAHTTERVVGGVATGVMGLNDTVTWEARHFGCKLRLTTRITELDRPRRFVDEQTSGPFASMRHTHEFIAVPTGTLMADDFQYSVPLGWLGRLFDKLVLQRYMRRLLVTRNDYLKRAAESKPAETTDAAE